MRYLSLLAAGAVLLACQPSGGALRPADQAAIEEARTRFAQAINQGDVVAVTGMYEENAALMPPNMPRVDGKISILEMMNGMGALGDFQSSNVAFLGDGDLVVVTGRYSLRMLPPGGTIAVADTGKFVEVWRRQEDGAWRMAVDIWNSNLPPQAMPDAP